MRIQLWLLIFILPFSLSAQIKINGTVYDKESNQPLPFATIATSTGEGTTTDMDGRFSFLVPAGSALIISYVGFTPDTIAYTKLHPVMKFKLYPKQIALGEVVITPGINPAHRIIKNVIQNKSDNDPLRYDAFSYTSYNKFVFSPDREISISEVNPESRASTDSVFAEHHLLLIESVSKRTRLGPGRDKEEILASRVSGLKTPMYQFIATQLQTFGFYENEIILYSKRYENPLTTAGLSHYLFMLEDTLYREQDTIFILSFRPSSGTKFEGMKGLLYIHTDGWAISNVIAEPADENDQMKISIRQEYEKIKGKWFPVRLNTDIIFYGIQLGPYPVAGNARSFIDSVKFNEDVEMVRFGDLSITTQKDAGNKDSLYWNHYRADSLSSKEKRTYEVIDSLGAAHNLDQKVYFLSAALSGEIPIGKINLVLAGLLDYNEYEGIRPGLQFRTNDKISRHFSLGGYGAFGIKDKAFKYGGSLTITPVPEKELEIDLLYKMDVTESGGLQSTGRQKIISSENYRRYLVNTMDSVELLQAGFTMRVLKYFRLNLFANQQQVNFTDGYVYRHDANNDQTMLSGYKAYETGTEVKFHFRETFTIINGRRISMGSNYPLLTLRFTAGRIKDANSYQRIDIRMAGQKTFSYLGTTSCIVKAGLVSPGAPYLKLFTGIGSHEQFSLESAGSFQTMRMNEFLADRFAAVFISHDFKGLLVSGKKFNPSPGIAWHSGFGKLDAPENHLGRSVNSFNEGYHEAGLRLTGLYNLSFLKLGLAGYYRLGQYAFEDPADNLTVKITLGATL